MNANHINLLISNCCDIFSSVGGLTLEKSSVDISSQFEMSHDYLLCFEMEGEMKGKFFFAFNKSLGEVVVKKMIENHPDNSDMEKIICDAFAEMGQMILISTVESYQNLKAKITISEVVVMKGEELAPFPNPVLFIGARDKVENQEESSFGLLVY